MDQIAIDNYLPLVTAVMDTPQQTLWSTYDAKADVLYINFKKSGRTTDCKLTEDDVIVRYEGKEIIGLTILHAKKRLGG